MQQEDTPTGRRSRPPGAERPAGALRRVAPYIRPYRWQFIVSFVVSLGAIGTEVAQPEVVKRFVDEVLEGGMTDRLGDYALLVLALGATRVSFAFVRRNMAGRVSLGMENDLRNDLYAHLQALPVSFHDGWQSGQLVSRAITDINAIRRFLGFGLMWLMILVVQALAVIGMQFRLDPGLAALTVVLALPVAVVSFRFAGKWRTLSKQVQNEQGDLTTIVEESATGVRIVKAFGRMGERSELFAGQARAVFDTNIRRAHARARFWSFNGFFLGASLVVVLLVGGTRVVRGGLSLGALVAFVEYTLMLAWPSREIGWVIAMAQEAAAASERVLEIMDTEPEIADGPDARPLASAHGEVRFEDVSFRYPGTDAWVLRDLTLDLRAGETLALVGMTGSGKTTVASFVSRFQDPTTGRVTLDGHDLRDLTLDSLRSHVGVAFEDPILFSVSVRENLLMGKPDATDEDIWEALAAAQADGFVRELPWALDTRVGEQGYSLSGGQRQRLALARAVVGRPRVLVLDNPLSSVDVHTEALIERALERILVGRSALLIAHRPSTILLADRVAVLHDGGVVATGTHHDLLEQVPLYREILAADAADEREGVFA